MGCVGLGNQPDRLATSLAAPMEPWMSLMEDAVICESGSKPDNMPCSSEQGASDRSEHREEGVLNATAEDFFSSLRQERWFLFILPAYYNQCTKQTLIPLISFRFVNKRKAVWERFGKHSRPLTQCLKHQSAAKNIKAATTLVLNGWFYEFKVWCSDVLSCPLLLQLTVCLPLGISCCIWN